MSTLERSQWRRGILASVVIGIAALLVVIYVTSGRDLASVVRQATATSLLGGATFILVAWLMRAVRFWLLIRHLQRRAGLFSLLQIYLATTFLSHITPFTTGGLPLQVYLLAQRHGLTLGEATAITGIDSVVNSLGVLVLLPLLPVWGLSLIASPDIRAGLQLLGLLLALLGGLVAYLLIFRPGWSAEGWLLRWAGRLRPGRARDLALKMAGGVAREWQSFSQALASLKKLPAGELFLLVLITMVYWAAYFGVAFGVLWGMGIYPPWQAVIVNQIVFNVLQALAPTPGGSGAAEWGMAVLFRNLVPTNQLATFVAVWRLFTFYSSLTLGGLAAARLLATPKARGPQKDRQPGRSSSPGDNGAASVPKGVREGVKVTND
ncbi:MAG: flippase-like domain-containing protein [Limnochordales bacterium]|nr:flippase-like domain-containing protein [Limnochordales bacterium]